MGVMSDAFQSEALWIDWTPESKALIYAIERDGMRVIIEQRLNGGLTETNIGSDEATLFDFGYSFDGQMLAVTRGGWQHDIILISDFNGD